MAKRKRDVQLKFRVTPQEREMIETKMAQFGTTNMAAYLRKMAIDGYVVTTYKEPSKIIEFPAIQKAEE